MLIIFLYSNNISNIQSNPTIKEFSNETFHYNSNSKFSWPLFGYYYISSYFGYRTSPTTGASSYHSGIDIPAPERH